MKTLNSTPPTVHIDGEERPADEVSTRCDNCGIPALDDQYCESCDHARLEKAFKINDKDTIREILESRIYNRTRGRTAQANFQMDKGKVTFWTSDDFRLEAEEFVRLLHQDSNNFTVNLDYTSRSEEEFRKFCVVSW